MQVEILDGVSGDLNALLPSEVDTVAIVNATPDAGQAEERFEIIEVTRGYGEASGAGSCLARQGDWWDILPVEVLEHLDDGSGLDSVIGSVFRMCRRRNHREPGRVVYYSVADSSGILDSSPRTPEVVLKLRVVGGNKLIGKHHGENSEGPRIGFEGLRRCCGNKPREPVVLKHRVIRDELGYVRLLGCANRAANAADLLQFGQILREQRAIDAGWRARAELVGTLHCPGRHISPR